MLLLCYVREIQDLVFFYKALYGYVDLDISKYVCFLNHDLSRQTLSPNLLLKCHFVGQKLSRTGASIVQLICGTLCVELHR